MPNEYKDLLQELSICVIIPTYNNAGTIIDVVRSVEEFCGDIFVVCDGPTDDTRERVEAYVAGGVSGFKFQVSGEGQPKANEHRSTANIRVVAYTPNKGKGTALTTGFREAIKQGFRYAITMDADGQHFATDIPLFAEYIDENEDAMLIGSRNLKQENMPQKNTFANKFSNFWFTVQTAHKLPDTQTGFRLYPLRKMGDMRLMTSRYEAELELLVRSAWRNIELIPLPINVYYPPAEERVSHFRPARDFTRISLLNTFFCFAAILYGYPSMILRKVFGK